MTKRKAGLAFVFAWFAFGGMGHFVAPDFFARIIPPELPLHREAVYISGVFELLGAAGLLFSTTRRAAGIGLFILTIAVTPANIYMWRNPQLFPQTPEILLSLRLVIQVFLLAIIWWSTTPEPVTQESA